MATLPIPTIGRVGVFDATKEYTFNFNYIGPQFDYVKLTICDNNTGVKAYEKKFSTHKSSVTYTPNDTTAYGSLSNNKRYNATITVYKGNDSSSPSSIVIFDCYDTPIVSFTNLTNNQIIEAATYTFKAGISHPQGDSISEYIITIFNRNSEIVSTSGQQYFSDEAKHTFYKLQDDEEYYASCDVVTKYGFKISTGMIKFSVRYDYVQSNLGLTVENIRDGYISITTNIIDVEYEIDDENKYHFDGDWLVIEDGNQIRYMLGETTNFSTGVFIAITKNPKFNQTLYSVIGKDGDIFNISVVNISDVVYVKLSNSQDNNYLYEKICNYSNYDTTKPIAIKIIRSNGLYDIDVNYGYILESEEVSE